MPRDEWRKADNRKYGSSAYQQQRREEDRLNKRANAFLLVKERQAQAKRMKLKQKACFVQCRHCYLAEHRKGRISNQLRCAVCKGPVEVLTIEGVAV